MLRRPQGWERIAVVGVLTAGAVALLFPLVLLVDRSRGHWGALFESTPALLVEPWKPRCSQPSSPASRRRSPWSWRARGDRAGAATRRRRGRVRAAPPRRLGGDARLRVPDRLRRGAARLPVGVVARPCRPVADRGAVRRPDRHARTPVDRPGVARGGGDARRVSTAEPAGNRHATCGAGVRRRCRVRIRDRARRVRSHRLRRPGRAADAAGRDLPLPGRPGEANQGAAAALAVVLAAIAACTALLAERVADGRGRAL